MAKVTYHKNEQGPGNEANTPVAGGVHVCTDKDGRTIGIKKLGPVERMRMFSIIGAENARNDAYLSIAALAFLVVEMDGAPVVRPGNMLQLEGLVSRLGDNGLEAIAIEAAERFAPEQIDESAVKNS